MVSKSLHRSIDLVNSVEKTIVTENLIAGKDRILLSISGGQDSICLLVLLNQLQPQMEWHMDFMWCHHLWQIDSFSLMRQMAKIGYVFQENSYFAITAKSIPSELLARNWRHNSSNRICSFYNYDKIALAHSASDRAETILLNIMRGTGIKGLSPLNWEKKTGDRKKQGREEHLSLAYMFSFQREKPCKGSKGSFFFWSPFFLPSFLFLDQSLFKEYKKTYFFLRLIRRSTKRSCKILFFFYKTSSKIEKITDFKDTFLSFLSDDKETALRALKKSFLKNGFILKKVKLEQDKNTRKKREKKVESLKSLKKERLQRLQNKTTLCKEWFDSVSYGFLKASSTSLEQVQQNSTVNFNLDLFQKFKVEDHSIVSDYRMIRPLLSLTRFEITQLCIFWRLPVYPDQSNQKLNFLRNRVRKQLLPTIKFFFNSRIEKVLLQFAEIFSGEELFMNRITEKVVKNCLIRNRGKGNRKLPLINSNAVYSSTFRTQKTAHMFHEMKTIPRYSVPIGATFWLWNRESSKALQVEQFSPLANNSKERKTTLNTFISMNKSQPCLSKKSFLANSARISQSFWEKRGTIIFYENFLKSPLTLLRTQNRKDFHLHSKNSQINTGSSEKFLLTFQHFQTTCHPAKKDNPFFISFLPIALQRRLVQMFLLHSNSKQVGYSQIEDLLTIVKKLSLKT